MNTGNPKLLVIPAGMLRSEGTDGTSPQERVLFYRRKQRKLRERIVHICQVIWQLVLQVCVCVCGQFSVRYSVGINRGHVLSQLSCLPGTRTVGVQLELLMYSLSCV